MLQSLNLSEKIRYARFRRHFKFNKLLFFINSVFIIFIFWFFIYKYHSLFFHKLNLLAFVFFKNSVIYFKKFYIFNLYYLQVSSYIPTIKQIIIFLVLPLIFILFFSSKYSPFITPINLWLNVISILYIISSLYFLFFYYYFPYTVKDFSYLYSIWQLAIFFLIPVVLGLSISSLSFSFYSIFFNFITISIALIYSVIFAITRYITFLYILNQFSYIHIAVMFLLLGPLVDFIFISFVYSIYLYILQGYVSKRKEPFKWEI